MQKLVRNSLSFLLLGLWAFASPSTALALDLVLACEGVEKKTFLHYDKSGKHSNITEESKTKILTLTISGSSIFGYPCREHENVITCNQCAHSSDYMKCSMDAGLRSINRTRIDRLSGQAEVSSMVEVDRLRVMTDFEGSCAQAKKRKF